jgi:hypothetical protein
MSEATYVPAGRDTEIKGGAGKARTWQTEAEFSVAKARFAPDAAFDPVQSRWNEAGSG